MSNASIIQRMQEVVDAYEANNMTATQVEEALEMYMETLERTQFQCIQKMRSLTHRLVTSDLFTEEQALYSVEDVKTVVQDLRAFISDLK